MITMGKKHELDLRDTAKAAYEEGYAEGLAEAREAEERFWSGIRHLIDDERTDELRRFVHDLDFREQVFEEYRI